MIVSAIESILGGEIIDKVEGRVNYVIRIATKKQTAIFVGKGRAVKLGYTCATFKEIAEKGYMWATFTYKKDAMSLINLLKKEGYLVTCI